MKLVSTVSSDQETWGCDYALIDLSPELARLALRRVNILKAQMQADQQLDEIYFWDLHVEYFSPWKVKEADSADILSEMLDKLPSVAGDLLRAPDDFAVPENLLEHVECSQMITREDGIAFIAIPKHASYYIRTAEVPLPLLESAARA
jgi:hypothetical protein